MLNIWDKYILIVEYFAIINEIEKVSQYIDEWKIGNKTIM